MDKWFDIKDNTPPQNKPCLVCMHLENNQTLVQEAMFVNRNWVQLSLLCPGEITHWMPVPEMPEEVSEDG